MLKNILGVLGTILSIFLILSPIPSMLEGLKKMEIKSMSLFYLFASTLNSMMWLNFGLWIKDIYVYGVNILGFLLFLSYMNLLIFIQEDRKYFIYINGIFTILFIIVYSFFSKDLDISIATFVSCGWQMTTIQTMRKALESKDCKFVNILLNYVSLSNFIDWVLYGIIIDTFMMTFVNFVCSVFCFFNIFVYHWSKGQISDDNFLIKILKTILKVDSSGNINEIKTELVTYNKMLLKNSIT